MGLTPWKMAKSHNSSNPQLASQQHVSRFVEKLYHNQLHPDASYSVVGARSHVTVRNSKLCVLRHGTPAFKSVALLHANGGCFSRQPAPSSSSIHPHIVVKTIFHYGKLSPTGCVHLAYHGTLPRLSTHRAAQYFRTNCKTFCSNQDWIYLVTCSVSRSSPGGGCCWCLLASSNFNLEPVLGNLLLRKQNRFIVPRFFGFLTFAYCIAFLVNLYYHSLVVSLVRSAHA